MFWERRAELLATTRSWLVGHGMLESLLEPHPGLTARSLLLHPPGRNITLPSDDLRFEVDAVAAAHVDGWRAARAVFDPIPVLGIPGTCDNGTAAFYDDRHNIPFDPARAVTRVSRVEPSLHPEAGYAVLVKGLEPCPEAWRR